MNSTAPPPTEPPAPHLPTDLIAAKKRLTQIIDTTGVGGTIRVQKDHVIAVLRALEATDDEREKDTAGRVSAVAALFTDSQPTPDDSWMDRQMSAVITERHGVDPTVDERETPGLFDKPVFTRMHEHLAAAHGSPMRALRLAVHETLQRSAPSDEEALARALYAEYRERIPGTLTWENDSKADEFRAQAGRLLPHIRSEVPSTLRDSRAGLISALEDLAVKHNLFDVLVAEEIADCALMYLGDPQARVAGTGDGQ